jgi:hypothetical protein
MSQLIKQVIDGYQIVNFEDTRNKEVIPNSKLILHDRYWGKFPNNFVAYPNAVLQAGIGEAELENEEQICNSAHQHADDKGLPFFELYIDHNTIPTGNDKPQKYLVSAEAEIRLYNWV